MIRSKINFLMMNCIDSDNNHYNYVFGDILNYSDTEEMNRILPKHASINSNALECQELNCKSRCIVWKSPISESQIFINTHSHNIKFGVWLLDVSDHFAVCISLPYNTVNRTLENTFIHKRINAEEKMSIFENKLSAMDWEPVYSCVGANEKYNYFFNILDGLQKPMLSNGKNQNKH